MNIFWLSLGDRVLLGYMARSRIAWLEDVWLNLTDNVRMSSRVECQLHSISTIAVLVYCHFLNRLPQTLWLETTQIYYLTLLEVRNVKRLPLGKITVLPGLCSLVTLVEAPLSRLFQLLDAACSCWLLAPSSILNANKGQLNLSYTASLGH